MLKPKAERDLLIIKKSGNKAAINKIQQIFKELSNTPYEGTGNPEALKYELSGYWSRRINKKDRLIYQVNEDEVIVMVIPIAVLKWSNPF
ncbi:MAG: Txe/YoeB family addiction module toxin [Chitinophagales bacterium]|jgi:toxin YoeB|nr:Txe/YoeB family addiction module toxin [Sphingobacteriales bacterium]